ncbi:hypothetical protein FXN63_01535 [Pigmentiphaga aceris]|uniref:DUF1795 domain-containing protein n=1 Tax=Pigmentiphaga aceris TaxID=1940612 RepID=A0A5C0ASP4_9BURK|nr:hypothetical protein [Pigmentiphaga aceris]QEI04666.1 hypothetical protein FXN63_01535 [Pigmentiphaga aceris]
MIFRKSLNVLGTVCLVAALGGTANTAMAADAPAAASASPAAATQDFSLLDGKLPFKLQGYEKRDMPSGAPGAMYYSAHKRFVIVNEESIPPGAPEGTSYDFVEAGKRITEQLKAASPAYKVVGENTENVSGLTVHHIEATSAMGGEDVLQATLMATANKKFAVIQVISDARDPAGHAAAVNNILGK